MNYPKTNLAVAVATVLALAGCGTAVEQDKGEGVAESFNARIVDGYLAGALVYVDSNDNGVLDAWEERAFTDRDGFVSVSAKGFNYCADGVKETDAVHCLKVRPSDSLKIRARGGYDMSTGEPFNGTLTLATTRAAGGNTVSPVVASPLTTLLAGMDAQGKAAFITKIGLSAEALGADFIKVANDVTTADQRKALTAAMQAHKLVEVLSGFLTEAYAGSDSTYSGLGKNTELPRDASEFVYASLIEALTGNNQTVNDIAEKASAIETVISSAKQKIETRIKKVTGKTSIEGDATLLATLFGRKEELASLGITTKSLFDVTTELTGTRVDARLRAINIIASVARDKAAPDKSVDDAVLYSADVAFMTSLEKPVDLARLVQKFKDNKAAEAVTAAAEVRVPIEQALKLTTDTAATSKLNLNEDGKGTLAIDFKTDKVEGGVATGGSLALDVSKFEAGGDLFKKEAGAPPTNVPGTWEKLNDYSLLVTIEPLPGVKQQAVVKPTVVDGVTKYFFDYGGKQIEWKGAVPQ